MLNAKNVLYELWYAAYLFQVLVGFGGRLLKVLDDALSHLEPEGVCHVQHVLLLVLSPCLPHVPPLLACLPLPCEVELGGSGHPILQVESLYLEVGLVNHSLKVDVVWCGHLAIILMPVHGGSVEDGTHSNSVIHFKLPGVLHDGGVEHHKSSLDVLANQYRNYSQTDYKLEVRLVSIYKVNRRLSYFGVTTMQLGYYHLF